MSVSASDSAPWWACLLVASAVIAIGWSLTREIQRNHSRIFMRAGTIALGLAPTTILGSGSMDWGLSVIPAWQAFAAGVLRLDLLSVVCGVLAPATVTFILWAAGMIIYE